MNSVYQYITFDEALTYEAFSDPGVISGSCRAFTSEQGGRKGKTIEKAISKTE